MGGVVLKAEHASFSYGSREVLRDVSLEIRSGDLLGLLGPYGGG
jgi:ABC-type lipopolysaccharide export system ATPase subunit